MKEGLFILFIVAILAALTAVRYRKQITGMIGFARMLRDARANVGTGVDKNDAKSIPLVNCSKCGVWVPQNKAIKVGDTYLCSRHHS